MQEAEIIESTENYISSELNMETSNNYENNQSDIQNINGASHLDEGLTYEECPSVIEQSYSESEYNLEYSESVYCNGNISASSNFELNEMNRHIQDVNESENNLYNFNDINNNNNKKRKQLMGRIIAEPHYFSSEILRLADEHNKHERVTPCTALDLKIVHYRPDGQGIKLFYECSMCSFYRPILSELPNDPKRMSLNESVILGTLLIGQGYYEYQELMAAMNIRAMSESTYCKYRLKLLNTFKKSSYESIGGRKIRIHFSHGSWGFLCYWREKNSFHNGFS